MTKVVTKVCDNTDSGSNEPVVRVKFRSRKFKFREKDETSTCVTEVLNSEKLERTRMIGRGGQHKLGGTNILMIGCTEHKTTTFLEGAQNSNPMTN